MSYIQISRDEVPELFCPHPAAVNANAADAEEHSLAWAQAYSLVPVAEGACEKLKAAKSALFAAYPMPDASQADLFLASDWALWLFVHDDFVDASTHGDGARALMARHARMEAILSGQHASCEDPPSVRALADLRDRVRARAPGWWFQRFVDVTRRQFQCHEWEAANTMSRRIPSLAAYTKMRPCVYWPCVLLAVIANDVKPDAAFLRHAYIRAITDMALNQIVWVNDIIGINHEIEEQSPHNLVLVLQNENTLTLQEALGRAAAMANSEMRSFIELEQERPCFGDEDPDARVYLKTLRDWMRGHLDWYRVTARYPFSS